MTVRDHEGLLVANDLGTSVTWQERPGLILSLEVTGLTENEVVDIANGVREVGEDEWRAGGGTQGRRSVARRPARGVPQRRGKGRRLRRLVQPSW